MPAAITIKGVLFLKIRVADPHTSFYLNAEVVCRPVVADSHNFDEEQDPDPDSHVSEKSDPDPAFHKSDALLLPAVCKPSMAPF